MSTLFKRSLKKPVSRTADGTLAGAMANKALSTIPGSPNRKRRKKAPRAVNRHTTTDSEQLDPEPYDIVPQGSSPKKRRTNSNPSSLFDDTKLKGSANEESDETLSNYETTHVRRSRGEGKVQYTPEQVQAFLDAVQTLQDWSRGNMQQKFVDLIRWLDFQKIPMKNWCANFIEAGYSEKDTLTEAYFFKAYAKHAPEFYKAKNIAFVPRAARRKAIPRKVTVETPKAASSVPRTDFSGYLRGASYSPSSSTEEENMNEFDVIGRISCSKKLMKASERQQNDKKLKALLTKNPKPVEYVPIFGAKSKTNIEPHPSLEPELDVPQDDVDRYDTNRKSNSTLIFRRKAGDSRLGHPSLPVLDRKCAAQYSLFLRAALEENASINVVEYEGHFTQETVQRFVACISPSIRTSLPTHDIYKETNSNGDEPMFSAPIHWTMHELQELYLLAHILETHDICDIIVNQWHKELHREGDRYVLDAFGELEKFDIVNFEPVFLNYVTRYDAEAFEFSTDILVTKHELLWNVLNMHGLDSWNDAVIRTLVLKLENTTTSPVGGSDSDAVCLAYHHHHQAKKRSYYKSPPTVVNLVPKLPGLEQKVPSSVGQMIPSDVGGQDSPGKLFAKKSGSKERDRRWKLQIAYKNITRVENKKGEGATIKKPGIDFEIEVGNSSDEEHIGNAITIGLPDNYNSSQESFDTEAGDAGNYSEVRDEEKCLRTRPEETVLRPLPCDRIIFNGYRMNRAKDTYDAAAKKLALIKEKLLVFRDHGYDVDFGDLPAVEEECSSDEEEGDDEGDEEDEDDDNDNEEM